MDLSQRLDEMELAIHKPSFRKDIFVALTSRPIGSL